ncbi:MAG TPA: phage tail protein [Bacillota bacterium]|nr:phage tail protein [Bacillota bacterium]
MSIFNAGISMAQWALGLRLDPYPGHNFLVEFDSLICAAFSEVSGLSVEIEVETMKVGGCNDMEYSFPKGTKPSNLVFKHGVTDSDFMWSWCEAIRKGRIERKSGSIFLLDEQRLPALWWDFQGAYPVKWEGPSLNAASTMVAVESLTLNIEQLIKPVSSQLASLARSGISAGQFF